MFLLRYQFLIFITSLFYKNVRTETVNMKLRATGCDDWCVLKTRYSPDNTNCLSSIQIDDKETLDQSAGLNIAIININNKKTEIKYVTKLGGLFFSGTQARKDFIEMINGINYDAVVAIVTLEMCFLRYSNWYSLLKDTKLKLSEETWTPNSNLAMVVGCIGECPTTLKGELPYLYAGADTTFSEEFEFELNKDAVTQPPPTPTPDSNNQTTVMIGGTKQSSSSGSPIIIIVIVVVVLLLVFIIFIVVIFKTKHGRRYRILCLGFCTKCHNKSSSKNGDVNDINRRRMFPNAAYAQQSNVIMISPETKGNYVNTDEDNNEYACLDQALNTNGPNRSQPNNYTYIDPKLDADARSEENLYYTATKDVMQQAKNEMMQRARSVTELTDLSIEETEESSKLMKPRSNTELSYLSVAPGTSHQIFKNSRENITKPNEISPTEKNFAAYVQVAEAKPLYKVPSNVAKHKPPSSPIPPVSEENFDEYVAMDGERTYDSCENPKVYQHLDNDVVNENMYESLTGT